MNERAGYYYIAINDSSIGALVASARRLREVDPNHPISVCTDQELSIDDRALFDEVISVPHQIDLDGFRELPAYPHQGLMGKVRYFYQSPYDVTIFMDTDTYAALPFTELFDIAADYDMAGSFCSGHFHDARFPDVPECFTMINTGMVMYRRNAAVKFMMRDWWNIMAEHKDPWSDQAFFLKALWDHRKAIKFLHLPFEYNFRFIFPMYAHSAVKLMHGRFDGIAAATVEVNKFVPASRIMYWNKLVCWYDPQKGLVMNGHS